MADEFGECLEVLGGLAHEGLVVDEVDVVAINDRRGRRVLRCWRAEQDLTGPLDSGGPLLRRHRLQGQRPQIIIWRQRECPLIVATPFDADNSPDIGGPSGSITKMLMNHWFSMSLLQKLRLYPVSGFRAILPISKLCPHFEHSTSFLEFAMTVH